MNILNWLRRLKPFYEPKKIYRCILYNDDSVICRLPKAIPIEGIRDVDGKIIFQRDDSYDGIRVFIAKEGDNIYENPSLVIPYEVFEDNGKTRSWQKTTLFMVHKDDLKELEEFVQELRKKKDNLKLTDNIEKQFYKKLKKKFENKKVKK